MSTLNQPRVQALEEGRSTDYGRRATWATGGIRQLHGPARAYGGIAGINGALFRYFLVLKVSMTTHLVWFPQPRWALPRCVLLLRVPLISSLPLLKLVTHILHLQFLFSQALPYHGMIPHEKDLELDTDGPTNTAYETIQHIRAKKPTDTDELTGPEPADELLSAGQLVMHPIFEAGKGPYYEGPYYEGPFAAYGRPPGANPEKEDLNAEILAGQLEPIERNGDEGRVGC